MTTNQQPADLRLTIVSTHAELLAFNTGELEPGVVAFVDDLGIFFKLTANRTWEPTTVAAASLEDIVVFPTLVSITVGTPAGPTNLLSSITIPPTPAGVATFWDVTYSTTIFADAAGDYLLSVMNAGVGPIAAESGTLVSLSGNPTVMLSGTARIAAIATPQTIEMLAIVTAPATVADARAPYLSARIVSPVS
jgi:hypothetical protein